MTSIGSNTYHKVAKSKAPSAGGSKKSSTKSSSGKPMSRSSSGNALSNMGIGSGRRAPGSRTPRTPTGRGELKPRGIAAPIIPATMSAPEAARLKMIPAEESLEEIRMLVLLAGGGRPGGSAGLNKPHTASSAQSRMGSAGDVAVAVAALGVRRTMHPAGVCKAMGPVLGKDAKAKAVPPSGKEGALFLVRALCEQVGAPAEPYVMPLLKKILIECASSNGAVRDAAEDAFRAAVSLAHRRAVRPVVLAAIFGTIEGGSADWRTKYVALQGLVSLSNKHPAVISNMLPRIVPMATAQVWDTKTQVTLAAKEALLVCCATNNNTDVAPAVPAVVEAIVKPSETVKALEKLMATTFVAAVDASTLAILCPVLSRGLKEKLALHKRMAAIVIENMSRLVSRPEDVAPFGPLLVPELRKVVENVQFEHMRDVAMAALKTLTRALGHSSVEEAVAAALNNEAEALAKEQERIEQDRIKLAKEEEERKKQEEQERKLWKEAMDAQRELDKMRITKAEEEKDEKNLKKEIQKTRVKTKKGRVKVAD
eukprot:CAMPEP_0113308822 /NCGR_PEP_ID=MMETSP0010_2-20120614/7118_1 /TAXON_ID=216773 ORGANISM="Corethron hystrix, Strain 308" /NCGR_SAMPLE_ID=MMETSP0010_2 /ASSEMBLY_ACC=CAM_ASM_000155 /LENGTH=538 /DNA_ID=CAMNT_0000163963 /DNA_START=315 /DNA_END=1932 /DNA_ORIENTATION=+ /assembly_acc=CAM_ASM_000155